MVIAGLPAPASAASDTVDFTGSGWGHGVGMSQWGAYGRAAIKGESYGQILAHYYRGATLATLPAGTTLWVNLEEKFDSKTLTVISLDSNPTPVQVKLDSQVINAEPGASIELINHGGSGCIVKVTNPGSATESITDPAVCGIDLSWYDWDSGADPKTGVQIGGCSLTDWNAGVNRPCRYGRGQLHLRSGSGGLYLSAEMLIDDYVLGISEIPYSWPTAALRAQAVAARSYAQARSIVRGTPTLDDYNGCWCQVRDTTSDQRYVGWGHGWSSWTNATTATARKVLSHPQGGAGPQDVITAYYSSSSGGRTEYGDLKGFSNSRVEWLTSVDDSYAIRNDVPNPNSSWVKSLNPNAVAQALGWDGLLSARVASVREGSGSAATVVYEGHDNGHVVEVTKTSTWTRLAFGLKSEYFDVDYVAPPGSQLDPAGDELLLYKSNGTFRYNSMGSTGILGAPINSGTSYTSGWKSISAIDLDGDRQDEIMFYREDGLYRYYEIGVDAQVGSPIRAGDDYTSGWDSISAVDLDGDGQDEMFFYREDGLYRYYDIASNGRIGAPIRSGDDYTSGWDSISAVDLDGDGQDEMFFYREDGLFRYYDIASNGRIGSPIRSGDTYTSGWDSIGGIDLEGDGQDEMFFYRQDGLYRFYDIKSNGSLGAPIREGSGFSKGWTVVTPINLDGR
jgi:SpoIID/LytB domain protein